MMENECDMTRAAGLKEHAFYLQRQDCKPSKKSSLTYHGFHLLQVGLKTLFSGLKIRTTNTKCSRPGVPEIWSYLEPEQLLFYEKRKLKIATNADFSFNPDWKKENQEDTELSTSGVTEFVFKHLFSIVSIRSYILPYPLRPSKLHFSYPGKGLRFLSRVRYLRYLRWW